MFRSSFRGSTSGGLWRIQPRLHTQRRHLSSPSWGNKLRSLLQRDKKISTGDTISAVLSGVVMGNILWVVLGTTTFGLATIYGVHYVDQYLGEDGRKPLLGKVASSVISLGLGVSVELTKLPTYNDGKLRFANFSLVLEEVEDEKPIFSATVDHMDVLLLFNKWYEGRGLINEMEIYGLQGKLIRNHGLVDPEYTFELVKVRDSVCRIYNEFGDSQPVKVTVFSADLSKVRGNRLLVDFFNAANVLGAINNSMFTIHKRQIADGTSDEKLIRFKLDGVNLGKFAKDPKLKFNWIINGRAEILADITLPSNTVTLGVIDQIWDGFTSTTTHLNPAELAPCEECERPTLLKGALAALYHTFSKEEKPAVAPVPYVMVKVTVKFHDIKATMPHYLPESSNTQALFVSLQNLRALVLCINGEGGAPPNPVVVKATAILPLTEFYNVLDISTTPMWDDLVGDVYQELLKLVKAKEQRIMSQRGLMWLNSWATQLVLIGLGVMV